MNRAGVIGAGLCSAGTLLVMVHGWLAWEADRDARDAQRAWDAARAMSDELMVLRERRALRALGRQPEEAFLGAVNRAAVEAGIGRAIASSIHRTGPRAGAAPGTMIEDVRIELSAMTVSELGGLLAVWRVRQPAWVVSTVSIRRPARSREGGGVFGVSVTFVAEYVVEGS